MSLPTVLAAYPYDAPIADLRTPELFVLHVMRLWHAHHDEPEPNRPTWQEGFTVAGIAEEGTAGFVSAMRIAMAASRRRLDIRCPRCPRLGSDEARFLQAIALTQHDRAGEAALVLADWLPPAALRAAMGPVVALASALSAKRLRVPLRHASVVMPGDLRIPVNAGRGLSLVH